MLNTVNLFAISAGNIIMWVIVAVLILFMIVSPLISGRKRNKEVNELFNSIEVGDEIMTLGGVMGKIVALTTHESGEKLMVIETGEGDNKTTMTFTIQALRLNYTKTKQRQEQLAKQKAEEEARKNGAALPLEEVKQDSPEEAEAVTAEKVEEGEAEVSVEKAEEQQENDKN